MLSEHVSGLRALRNTTYREYSENRILRGYVERTLQVCAQIGLDVGVLLVQSDRHADRDEDQR